MSKNLMEMVSMVNILTMKILLEHHHNKKILVLILIGMVNLLKMILIMKIFQLDGKQLY